MSHHFLWKGTNIKHVNYKFTVSEILETFEQNADDSGKSTEDKTF